MPSLEEPKLISGNANRSLANAIARRMSMHRGMNIRLVDARVERFNDQEIFVEVFENVRGEDMFIIQPTSNPARLSHSRASDSGYLAIAWLPPAVFSISTGHSGSKDSKALRQLAKPSASS